MVKTKTLIETTDELMEQIVLTFFPERDIYKDMPDGSLRIKKRYGELRVEIYEILNNNLNGGAEPLVGAKEQHGYNRG